MLPDIEACEKLACSLGFDAYVSADASASQRTAFSNPTLADLFQSVGYLILGPDVRSTAVIDLAARIGLEATQLRLPLVSVLRELPAGLLPPGNSILVGVSNRYVEELIREGKFSPPVATATGCVTVVEQSIVVAGADAEGEDAALRHVAQRMPYLWEYGKGNTSDRSI